MIKLISAAALVLAATATGVQAQGRGTYRAVGTEPFWSLTITPQTMRFEQPSERAIVVPTPRAVIPRLSGRFYRTGRMIVAIRPGPCSDGMSDRSYEETVRVTIDGHTYGGCGGGFVEPSRLANTNWRISAINGRAVPADGPYRLDFTEDRLSGQAGCNRFSGGYRLQGDRLTPGPVMSTRMACPGRMADEAAALRILEGPLTVSQPSEHRMILRGAGGALTLEMVPGARPRR